MGVQLQKDVIFSLFEPRLNRDGSYVFELTQIFISYGTMLTLFERPNNLQLNELSSHNKKVDKF